MRIFDIMFNFMDAILLLINYKFLDIFWFYFWIFWCGELLFYTVENLIKVETIVRWYDLGWLMSVFCLAFITAYRLYVLTIDSLLESK